MKTAPRNQQLDKAVDRIAQKDAEQFRQQQLARFKRERAQQQGQRDIEASNNVETSRQIVESPS